MNPRPLNPEEETAASEAHKAPGSYNVDFEQATQKERPKKRSRIRPPSQTYDHIIAERKRREQLSQLFIALSAIVPGLKKVLNFLNRIKMQHFIDHVVKPSRSFVRPETYKYSLSWITRHIIFNETMCFM